MSTTIDIPSSLLSSIHSFRLTNHPSISAQIFKIDKSKLELTFDQQLTNISTIEDVIEELPENTPRFVLVSYKLTHKDARVSYPLFLLYWAPPTSSLEQSTLYASALSNFSVQSDVAKVIDVRDGEISTSTLEERLGA